MSLSNLDAEKQIAARHLLAEAQRAIRESNSKEVQRTLAELTELGIDAIPPEGHSCNFCYRPGQLYCYATAVNSARGTLHERK